MKELQELMTRIKIMVSYKTSWGKNELMEQMNEVYTQYLQELLAVEKAKR